MKIAIYAEHCVQAAAVAGSDLGDFDFDPEVGTLNDYNIWEGTEDELEIEARANLALRDTRAGGSGYAYTHRAARSILCFLGCNL